MQIKETTIPFFGMPKNQLPNRINGVAIVLSSNAEAAGADVHPVSERILWIQLKMYTSHMPVIAVYVPTNDESQEGGREVL